LSERNVFKPPKPAAAAESIERTFTHSLNLGNNNGVRAS